MSPTRTLTRRVQHWGSGGRRREWRWGAEVCVARTRAPPWTVCVVTLSQGKQADLQRHEAMELSLSAGCEDGKGG